MSTTEPTPLGPTENPPSQPAGPPPSPAAHAARADSPDPRRLWALALGGSLVAGLVAWLGGEWADRSLDAPLVSEFEVGGNIQFAQQRAAVARKAVVAYGLLGSTLGLVLGLAGGLARRSPRAGALAALAGLVVGAAAGAGAAFILVPLYFRSEVPLSDDLLLPLLTHGGIWAPIGLAAGLALGLGLGGPRRAIARAAIGGLAGAVVATLACEVIGAVAFPLAQTGKPLSATPGSRLFARLVVALLAAAGAALAARDAGRMAKPGPVADEVSP